MTSASISASTDAKRYIIGAMSGSSCDGIDACIISVTGHGLNIRCEIISGISHDFGDFSQEVLHATQENALSAGAWTTLKNELSERYAALIQKLMNTHQNLSIDFVCVHGQTVFHKAPATWQLINAPLIAQRTGLNVCFDLRSADCAQGGQGAPLSPMGDLLLYPDRSPQLAVVNLGGFANVSLLPQEQDPAQVRGYDIIPCNHLLDRAARALLDQPYDEDGACALLGTAQSRIVEELYQRCQELRDQGRSLGSGDELHNWWEQYENEFSASTILRSACTCIARCIIDGIDDSHSIALSGGGTRNTALMDDIKKLLPERVSIREQSSLFQQYREAALMGVLGACCADGIPITHPSVSGCTEAPLSGSWCFPSLSNLNHIFSHD